MSLGYAQRLKKGVWKGKCGKPELFDPKEVVEKKVTELAKLVKESSHLVVYTGAGLSTSAGINDFRGPQGVWTIEEREERGERHDTPLGTSFNDAKPTVSHMALVGLYTAGILKYVVTQNVDNLHMKSGLPREVVSELHGNVFMERCSTCSKEYVGNKEVDSIGFKPTGNKCECGGILCDVLLDWDDALPEKDLDLSDEHSKKADLALCLGTSLQIVPARDLPVKATRKHKKPRPGTMVIVNLQSTPRDSCAGLIIHAKCDEVMSLLMQKLAIDIPVYKENHSTSKRSAPEAAETEPHKKIKSELLKTEN